MGMGGAKPGQQFQQPVAGMGGKGGAARPNVPTAPQQPVAGMGGKGVSQQPVQPVAGMGGKGVSQQPVQPVAGMGGKGVGQPLPPQVQPGMGGKGVGQPLPPQVQPPVQGMGGKGGAAPRGVLTGFGPNDMAIYSNDPNAVPYTGPSMGGYFVNGVPAPRPVQQPVPQPVTGMGGKGGAAPAPAIQPWNEWVQGKNQDANGRQYLTQELEQMYRDYAGLPAGAEVIPRSAYMPAPAPAPAPAPVPAPVLAPVVQPKGNLSSALAGLRTPVPVQPAAPQQAAQRTLQALAAKARR